MEKNIEGGSGTGHTAGDSPPGEGSAGPGGIVRRSVRAFLRIPLFYKIILANVVIIAAPVLAVMLLIRINPELMPLPPERLLGIPAAVVIVLATAVNAVIVRVALVPLRELQETVERVQDGDLDARAAVSLLADRELRRLISVFNGMLDRLSKERERRRRLTVRALRAEERARRQLAADLHNDTAQRLAAHILRLNQVRGVSAPEEKDRLLEEAREEAAETLEEVRRTARGLHPVELEDLGLAAALRALARKTSGTSDAEVVVEDTGGAEEIPEERRVAVYRILQEAVYNALRHSGADRITVRIGSDAAGIRGEVEDDGRGFDVTAPGPASRAADAGTHGTDGAGSGSASGDPGVGGNGRGRGAGLGLLAMEEVAAELGGRVEIESAPGEGTRVRVTVPLRAPEPRPGA